MTPITKIEVETTSCLFMVVGLVLTLAGIAFTVAIIELWDRRKKYRRKDKK